MQRFGAEVTCMEAKIDTANLDLDAFGQGGPGLQTPTAITDRMHALLVTRADALAGCAECSPEAAELATLRSMPTKPFAGPRQNTWRERLSRLYLLPRHRHAARAALGPALSSPLSG